MTPSQAEPLQDGRFPSRDSQTAQNETYRLSSRRSQNPEDFRPSPSPQPDRVEEEENAPPPAEKVTRLRLGAHYAGLVLASMLGSLIRLGLEGLTTCEGWIYDGADQVR